MFGRVMDMTSYLVIDDCNDDQDRAIGLLQNLELDVRFASSEDEAIQVCQSEKPTMILVADAGDKRKTSTMLIRLKAIASQLKEKPFILMRARSRPCHDKLGTHTRRG